MSIYGPPKRPVAVPRAARPAQRATDRRAIAVLVVTLGLLVALVLFFEGLICEPESDEPRIDLPKFEHAEILHRPIVPPSLPKHEVADVLPAPTPPQTVEAAGSGGAAAFEPLQSASVIVP